MICTVYWRKGGFILVPDCIRASQAVERQYGPLRHCGRLDTERLPSDFRVGIESDIERELFASLSPELAMQLGYEAVGELPLPDGFAWREGDWWKSDGNLALLHGTDPPVVVADIVRGPHGGWVCTTNSHRPWAFRGGRVCATRGAAVQYLTMWADDHAAALRAGDEPRGAASGLRPLPPVAR